MNWETEGLKGLNQLIGTKVKKVFMSSQFLRFVTDKGNFTFTVEGDCCSSSYFHDFVGLDHLRNNGPITKIEEIALDVDDKNKDEYDVIQAYGFRFTTIHPTFGEVSSVMSFRNSSNGYYGGWLEGTEDREVQPELKEDSFTL